MDNFGPMFEGLLDRKCSAAVTSFDQYLTFVQVLDRVYSLGV